MYENIIFSIANFLFLISSYPMIKNVLKNKNNLKGYSKVGSQLTFLGLTLMILGFMIIKNFISVFFNITNIILLVFCFVLFNEQ